jgi:hypothetical protein
MFVKREYFDWVFSGNPAREMNRSRRNAILQHTYKNIDDVSSFYSLRNIVPMMSDATIGFEEPISPTACNIVLRSSDQSLALYAISYYKMRREFRTIFGCFVLKSESAEKYGITNDDNFMLFVSEQAMKIPELMQVDRHAADAQPWAWKAVH